MYRVKNIRVSINNSLEKKLTSKLHISKEDIKDITIVKKSIDARDKNNICYVYTCDIDTDKKIKHKDVSIAPKEEYIGVINKNKLKYRPVIVGAGPAGLFTAYLLSEKGYNPIIIERGSKIEERVDIVNKFWEEGILDENTNVQFGEGGAGTFSDGKLGTLVSDKNFRMKKVFEIFVSCGAPKEIMYESHPHIGTDRLYDVVINMRNKIISMGGEFKYNTKLTDIVIENNCISKIITNKGEIITDTLVLAIGHSARDTFEMLYNRGLKMESKAFAVGLRIMHSQSLINKNQYGNNDLGSANYKLVTNINNHGVYSFCMCPGGYVINASSHNKYTVINGMSNYNRDSEVANSAIVVTVNSKDYGYKLFDGMHFQQDIERKAYVIGRGSIPVQTFADYKENKVTNKGTVCVKGKYVYANLNYIFPGYINDLIKKSIEEFDKKINGFKDGTLAGVESRTSSPIRIVRENYMSNIKGIYPCGEGAGYSGGITSSAMDGIKVAEAIMSM